MTAMIAKMQIDSWQTFREIHNYRKTHMAGTNYRKKNSEFSGKVQNPDRTETKVIIERFSAYPKSGNRVRKKWLQHDHRRNEPFSQKMNYKNVLDLKNRSGIGKRHPKHQKHQKLWLATGPSQIMFRN